MTAETSTTIDLRPLFAPRSIAVVGASPRSGIAQTVRDNLRVTGSATRCHFVNPRYPELSGQPCFPSIDALPERPDVVLVALNPGRAAAATAEAARAGVPAVVIPGGGIVEGGEPAARMQAEVAAIAREHGMALVGPNCMGVWDLTTNSSVYIGDVSPYLPRGGVAAIAQSGSVADAFIHSGSRTGFSRIVSCGSEVTLDVCDYLAWCLDDAATTSVVLFLEGLKRPERFLALADRALELGKPILAVKVGRSGQAQAAAVAHSGSLAGETRVTEAALDAAGVVRCTDLDELLEAAELVEGCRRMGRGVGAGRTAVVTVSTGEASLVADLVPKTRLDLPPIPADAQAAILARLPTMTYLGNPLDPWGAADAVVAYGAAFEALAACAAYDVLAVVHDFPYRSLPSEVEVAGQVATCLVEATAGRSAILPVYVSLTSGEPPPETKALLDSAGGVPLLRGAVEAFSAISAVARWEARRALRLAGVPRRPGWPALGVDRTSWAFEAPVENRPPSAPRVLSEAESLGWLAAEGFSVSPFGQAADPAAAAALASGLGFPVALKLDAVGLAHKTEAGGVRLGLRNPDEVSAAAAELLAIRVAPPAAVRGLLVQPMAASGVELIVGLRRDPQFGPAVLVGLGGILAQAFDDVSVRLAPLTLDEAMKAVRELRGARLLDGYRGRPRADVEAVAALMVRLGDLGWRRPEVAEIDLNPVLAGPDGALAVDALVLFS